MWLWLFMAANMAVCVLRWFFVLGCTTFAVWLWDERFLLHFYAELADCECGAC